MILIIRMIIVLMRRSLGAVWSGGLASWQRSFIKDVVSLSLSSSFYLYLYHNSYNPYDHGLDAEICWCRLIRRSGSLTKELEGSHRSDPSTFYRILSHALTNLYLYLNPYIHFYLYQHTFPHSIMCSCQYSLISATRKTREGVTWMPSKRYNHFKEQLFQFLWYLYSKCIKVIASYMYENVLGWV